METPHDGPGKEARLEKLIRRVWRNSNASDHKTQSVITDINDTFSKISAAMMTYSFYAHDETNTSGV